MTGNVILSNTFYNAENGPNAKKIMELTCFPRFVPPLYLLFISIIFYIFSASEVKWIYQVEM